MTRAAAAPPGLGLPQDDPPARWTAARCACVLYAGCVPFDGLPVGGRSVPFLASVVFVVATVLENPRRAVREALPTGVIAAISALVLFATLSTFWATDPEAATRLLPSLYSVTVVTMLLPTQLRAVWRPSTWAYCLSSAILATVVLMAPADSYTQRRTAFGNENDVAALLVIGMILAVHLASTTSAWRGVAALATAVACATGVLATGSRTGAIAGAVGVTVLLLGTARRRGAGSAPRVVAVAAVGALVLFLLPPAYVPDRIGSTFDALATRDLSGREEIWARIWTIGFDPLGRGLGATGEHLGASLGPGRVAHNVLLGIGLELGLVGLALFGVVILCGLARMRLSETRTVTMPLVVAVAIVGMATSIEWRRSLWFVLALAVTIVARTPGTGPHETPRPSRGSDLHRRRDRLLDLDPARARDGR